MKLLKSVQTIVLLLSAPWHCILMANAIDNCNPSYFSFNPRQYGSKVLFSSEVEVQTLEPRTLDTRIMSTRTAEANPNPSDRWNYFSNPNSQFVFHKSGLYYTDSCTKGWSEDTDTASCLNADVYQEDARVFALDMWQQAEEMFYADYSSGDVFCNFDNENIPKISEEPILDDDCYIFRTFQKQYPETRREVTFDSNLPSNIAIGLDGRYVAWNEETHSGHKIIILYDSWRKSTLPTPLNGNGAENETVVYGKPVFCSSNFLIFEKTVQVNGDDLTEIWLYEIEQDLMLKLSSKSFYPTASTTSNMKQTSSSNSHMCTAAWLHLPDNKMTSQSAARTNSSISVLQLPSKIRLNINPNQWRSKNFVNLEDVALSGDFLYIIVSNSDRSLFKIKWTSSSELDCLEFDTCFEDVEDSLDNYSSTSPGRIFKDVHNTLSETSLRFGKNSRKVLLYWKKSVSNSTDEDELRLLSGIIPGVSAPENPIHCAISGSNDEAISGSNNETRILYNQMSGIIDAYVYDDTVIWTSVDLYNSSHLVFKVMDLDKDNDGSFDVIDKFPAHFDFYLDTDGDGYADKRDLVNRPGINDDAYLYIVWAVTMFITLISVAAVINRYKHVEAKILEEQSQSQNDYSLKSNYSSHGRRTTAKVTPMNSGADFGEKGNEKCFRKLQRKLFNQDINELQMYCIKTLYNIVDVILMIFTGATLVLAIVPKWSYTGTSPSLISACIWTDFFVFGFFSIELGTRLVLRDRKQHKSAVGFLLDNYYDLLALLTDIPLTTIRLPDLLGLLKGFRAVRLYNRFTQKAIFINLMIKQPLLFIACFVALLIIICAVFLKIIEQHEQEEFRDFPNVVWFAFVTASTVGYGDLSPKNIWGKLITLGLMMIGIGLFSTLSAFSLASIVAVEKAEQAKDDLKENFRLRLESMKLGLMHISQPYNPVSAVLKICGHNKEKSATGMDASFFVDNDADDPANNRNSSDKMLKQKLFSTAITHASTALNPTIGVRKEVSLPLDALLKGADGKFRVNAISSHSELIMKNEKEREKNILEEASVMEEDPRTRLVFMLKRLNISNEVANFAEFANELGDIIFEAPRQGEHFLAKTFLIQAHFRQLDEDSEIKSSDFPFLHYCLHDPVHSKLIRIDEHFQRYQLEKRSDYSEIISEMTFLINMYDRVLAIEWAFEWLEFKENVKPAVPLHEDFQPPPAAMPKKNSIIVDLEITEDS